MGSLHSIFIGIADLLIELTSPLSAAELGIEQRLGPFFARPDDSLPRASLRWEESDGPPAVRGALVYAPGAIWRMYREGDACYAAIAYTEGHVRGLLRANATWDDVTLTEQRTGPGWQSLLNTGAGELLVRTRILLADGLVMHAAGIDDDGRGLVFAGHSGAGKSTQVGLWCQEPGVVAMNDDRIAVRVVAGGAWCYGTPWGGTADIARNHDAPLRAIVLLEQASENSLQPLPPAVAAPQLLARAFLPYWDGALIARACANLDALLTQVPVYRLRCRPGPAVIPLVRSVL